MNTTAQQLLKVVLIFDDSIPLSQSCILWPSTWEVPRRNLKILLLSDAFSISITLMLFSCEFRTCGHLKLCVVQRLKFCYICELLLAPLTFSYPHLHFLCGIFSVGLRFSHKKSHILSQPVGASPWHRGCNHCHSKQMGRGCAVLVTSQDDKKLQFNQIQQQQKM